MKRNRGARDDEMGHAWRLGQGFLVSRKSAQKSLGRASREPQEAPHFLFSVPTTKTFRTKKRPASRGFR